VQERVGEVGVAGDVRGVGELGGEPAGDAGVAGDGRGLGELGGEPAGDAGVAGDGRGLGEPAGEAAVAGGAVVAREERIRREGRDRGLRSSGFRDRFLAFSPFRGLTTATDLVDLLSLAI